MQADGPLLLDDEEAGDRPAVLRRHQPDGLGDGRLGADGARARRVITCFHAAVRADPGRHVAAQIAVGDDARPARRSPSTTPTQPSRLAVISMIAWLMRRARARPAAGRRPHASARSTRRSCWPSWPPGCRAWKSLAVKPRRSSRADRQRIAQRQHHGGGGGGRQAHAGRPPAPRGRSSTTSAASASALSAPPVIGDQRQCGSAWHRR